MYQYLLKLKICNKKPFFGPGSVMLLKAIEQTGSLNQACENMNLSYSKGRKMLKDILEETGLPAIEFKHGGLGGGQAKITQHGKELLETYQAFLSEVDNSISSLFDKYYGEKND